MNQADRIGIRRWSLLAAGMALAVASAVFAAGKIEARAAAGKPLGAGRITVPLDAKARAALGLSKLADYEFISALRLTEADGRVLYPVFADGAVAMIEEAGDEPPDEVNVDFLFKGSAPLNLTFTDPWGRSHKVKVTPKADKDAHATLLGDWWDVFCTRGEELAEADLYPPQMDNYLLATMSRRLKLRMPSLPYRWTGQPAIDRMFGLLLGAESVRIAMQKETLLRNADAIEKPDQPLPKGATIPPVKLPPMTGVPIIEPMAMRVPLECFYIRCGSFANFRWLRGTIDKWGGSIRNLVSVRGVDYGLAARLERQLALKESVLSKVLGGALISDVAVIGTDTFLREGAAIGIIFEARNTMLLGAQFKRLRAGIAESNPAAAVRTVAIGGRNVSLLSTPDNAVRSFYAVDGNFHLVTTSRKIVARFLETGKNKTTALGASAEFRYGRWKVPLSRDDTLFVYLSDPFFHNLISPSYRVEMTRRTRALGDIELIHLARLAARAEGAPGTTIKQLIAGGFLPAGFTRRIDSSHAVLEKGRIVDSLRGARGTFLPVPDVEITGVTESEAHAYNRFARMYRGQWEKMDPVIIALKRSDGKGEDKGIEHIVADILITPYARERYRQISAYLRQTSKRALVPITGDIASLDVFLADGREEKDVRRMFAGIRDFAIPFTVKAGAVVPSNDWYDSSAWGYVGEMPNLKNLKYLFGDHMWKQKDKDGYCTSGSYWGRLSDDFAIWANNKMTLEWVTPQLKLKDTPRAAQLRLRIADLSYRRIAKTIRAYGYTRARGVSAANVFYIDAVCSQFRLPAAQGRAAVERILGASLTCPLGGKYVLADGASARWRSTAWTAGRLAEVSSVPKDYRFALLRWFRGLSLEFTLDRTTLQARVELDLDPSGLAAPRRGKSR